MNFMDIFKLLLGVLLAGVIGLGAAQMADLTSSASVPAKMAYPIAADADSSQAANAGADTEKAEESVLDLLVTASAEKGKKVAKKCTACHTFDQGGPNRTGPNLWDVVNKAKASAEGFSYSNGLAAMGAAGEVWTYESIDKLILKPKAYISDTKMSFAGLKKVKDRANMIAYLRSLSDSPAPLPTDAAEATDATEAEMAPASEDMPAATDSEAPADATTAQ